MRRARSETDAIVLKGNVLEMRFYLVANSRKAVKGQD